MDDKENGSGLHYVLTHDEAKELAAAQEEFWILDCRCRKNGPGCKQSPMDLCLSFVLPTKEDAALSPHKATREEVNSLIDLAGLKMLVTSPYRSRENPEVTDGICFCCNDCCEYITGLGDSARASGPSIEKTDPDKCIHCMNCVDSCYFGARCEVDDMLVVETDKCLGCGLCVPACPEDAIEMIKRINTQISS